MTAERGRLLDEPTPGEADPAGELYCFERGAGKTPALLVVEEAPMTARVDVKPELLRWARERARLDLAVLVRRFPKYIEWERGTARPTLKEIETFARTSRAPVGYFFLPEAPIEEVPIPDFRTVGDSAIGRPSPEMLDTVYLCQQRQDWYREFARVEGEGPRPFVGSASIASDAGDIEATAAQMRRALGFDLDERDTLPTWSAALRRFGEQAEALGVLVMVSGIVGNSRRRRLDPEEFRGFALADPLAPVVFVNGADTKAAQMFTLAHELAHLWLGGSALSDVAVRPTPVHRVEAWCNRVAAELLVPGQVVRAAHDASADLFSETQRLARRFKVSTLVVLRRLKNTGRLDEEEFRVAYGDEIGRLNARPAASGGSFHPTLRVRVGRRFGHALVTSTLEGRTSFSESLRLLGIRKMSTFREFAETLGAGR